MGVHQLRIVAALGADHIERLPEQRRHLQLRVEAHVVLHNGHVQLPAGNGLLGLLAGQGFHPQGHRQVPLQKPLVYRRQHILIGGVGSAEAEVGPGLGGGNAVHLGHQPLPPPGQGQKPGPRLRQLQPPQALTPDKQRRPHLVLQGLEPGGKGGLGDIKRLGGGGHGPAAQHRQKGFDLHIRHVGALLKL